MARGGSTSGRTLRAKIDRLLAEGVSVEEIERRVIDPAPLSEELRSALWLYAWAAQERRLRRAASPA